MAEPLLFVRGAIKRFGGVAALNGASLDVYAGEVHALLGENGAGKSTLLKTLAGVHKLDSGEIRLGGADFEQGSTRRSLEQGFAVIYQEPSLSPDLTLAENVFVGRQLMRRGRVDWAATRARAASLFAELGVPLDPDRRAAGLSIADQQLVEIVKALSTDARVIVMDEPTAALSANEADRLIEVARRIRDRGPQERHGPDRRPVGPGHASPPRPSTSNPSSRHSPARPRRGGPVQGRGIP